MVCGYLLARAGVDVIVLEKHKDFLRDFRGDTIHPSTLELFVELGLIDAFLARPHDEVHGSPPRSARTASGRRLHAASTRQILNLHAAVGFLDFIAGEARNCRPSISSWKPVGEFGALAAHHRYSRQRPQFGDITANLVIGADGLDRARQADLPVIDIGAPSDVL